MTTLWTNMYGHSFLIIKHLTMMEAIVLFYAIQHNVYHVYSVNDSKKTINSFQHIACFILNIPVISVSVCVCFVNCIH